MKQEYLEENRDLFKNFLNFTFFKNWKNSYRHENPDDDFMLLNYSSLEMNIGYSCDLGCEYCYYKRNGKDLYQGKAIKADEVLKNTDKLMNFMHKNELYANYELFAGEPFVLNYIWDWFDIVFDYLSKTKKEKRTRAISVPTNLSFLKSHNKEKFDKILKYIDKFKSIDVKLALSGSFDGPFIDKYNRKFTSDKLNYNKEFYDNFIKNKNSLGIGAHPMIYSNKIESWIDNFIWFVENDTIPYLLDVRNWEWNEKQLKDLFFLMRFIVNYLSVHSAKSGKSFKDLLDLTNGFNILIGPISTTGRGMGCSMQSVLDIQLHTLEIIPCHRLGYEQYSTGQLILNEDGTWDLTPKNVEFYIAEQATDSKSISPCSGCPINKLCAGTCLGANYEATGDPFTVPPSFCRESIAKVSGIMKGYEDIGYIDNILAGVDNITRSQIKFVLEEFKEL